MNILEQSVENAVKKIAARTRIKQVLIGIATEIGDKSCTVIREDAPTLFDVRFNSIIDELESYITVIPKEGSIVLVAIIEDKSTEAVLLRASEIDKLILKIGETQLEINNKGYLIAFGEENLHQLLLDIITEITKIIVVHGTSPDVPALQKIAERVKKQFIV